MSPPRPPSARPGRTKPEPPAATTVLLVRHGQTPSTGTTLPGRAKGLHLADSGRAQANPAAARIAKLDKVTACTPRPSSAPGRRPHPSPPVWACG